jgi:hypothetical protein
MAGNALTSGAVGFMMCVSGSVAYALFMAREAGVVDLCLLFETIAAARCVTVHAVEFAGFGAGAHEPRRIGVVLPEVPAVGVIVGALERYKVEMVEKSLAGRI